MRVGGKEARIYKDIELASTIYIRCTGTFRVGHNCICTPSMTVYLVISVPKCRYRLYTVYIIYMVLANPKCLK